MDFPKIIKELLTCPGLLRLREIRLGNIPFLSFPSFSNCTRYEHSLGVAHLAELASNTLQLDAHTKYELIIAALYHDLATPPFAHAGEAVFKEFFDFNHEEYLNKLLIGATADVDYDRTQIYRGRSVKLHKILQSKSARKIGIELDNIINISMGNNKLSSIISHDIDIDNIDNISRASNSIGYYELNKKIIESIVNSYVFVNNDVAFSEKAKTNIEIWKKNRYNFYTKLYYAINDQSYEAMIRECIKICINDKNQLLTINDWKLTEKEMMYIFYKNKESNKIIQNVLLGKPYNCIFAFSCYVKNDPQVISEKISDYVSDLFKLQIYSIFFKDTRERKARLVELHHPLIVLSDVSLHNQKEGNPYFFLFFSSASITKLTNEKKVNLSDFVNSLPNILDNCHDVVLIKYLNSDLLNYTSNGDKFWKSVK